MKLITNAKRGLGEGHGTLVFEWWSWSFYSKYRSRLGCDIFILYYFTTAMFTYRRTNPRLLQYTLFLTTSGTHFPFSFQATLASAIYITLNRCPLLWSLPIFIFLFITCVRKSHIQQTHPPHISYLGPLILRSHSLYLFIIKKHILIVR